MTSSSPSRTGGTKRARQSAEGRSPALSSFRNVSACNRCRLRKNRCDQRLPACAPCERAHANCVGYDVLMHREIPRSYVYFLESRVSYLESLLEDNSIPFALPEAFQAGAKSRSPQASGHVPASTTDVRPDHERSTAGPLVRAETSDTWDGEENDAEKVNKLVSNIGMVSVHGVSNPRYLGSTSGISFARIVFAAIKSSIPSASSERNGSQGSRPSANGSGDRSMRESFFGLQVRPTIKQAPFPNKDLGLRLVNLYFDHANPQMPILHKGEFMTLFDKVYTSEERNGTPRDLYMLNIVFAIGAGTTLEDIDSSNSPDFTQSAFATKNDPTNPSNKRQRLSTRQHQPEEYHASAIVHLESFLGSSQAADRADGFGGGLEELQAVLLLAGFALLRPVAPGLWYIVGVAVRLAVDLGLHYEDGTDVESERDGPDIAMADPVATDDAINSQRNHRIINAKERGRREWIRDLRRRLWWCVYSFDRLVSVCVGRPFGITDQVITTDFPSLLDDCYITPAGFLAPPENPETSSYKVVAHHYFRFRLLQSEILQVLQYQQVQQVRQVRQVRACDNTKVDEYMLNKLPSPFLLGFDSFRLWRKDINRRLREWKDSAPLQQNIDVRFSVLFFELNYWQAVIMLYRQSLSVPPRLADGLSLTDDVSDPSTVRPETLEDEDDIFLRVAEAGQKVLRIYRQLHRLRLVNYTFLATHHLFMAGIAFLYAIWHSCAVRNRLTLDDVDFTVLAATSVLGDLIGKCPPAEACRDAFERMSKATVQMCLSTTGFGSQASGLDSYQDLGSEDSAATSRSNNPGRSPEIHMATRPPAQQASSQTSRQPPKFDMDLGDLFPESIHLPRSHGNSRSNPPGHPAFSKRPKEESPPYAFDPQNKPGFNLGNAGDATSRAKPLSDTRPQDQHAAASPMQTDHVESGSWFHGNGVFDSSGTEGYESYANVDLGFDLGLDGEHDWSDGTQFDLFDGFFFGGTGGTTQ